MFHAAQKKLGTNFFGQKRAATSLPHTLAFEKTFICPEESSRYASSLEQLVFNKLQGDETIIEFGSGSGSPVIAAIRNSGFSGIVHGYEISPEAAETAEKLIAQNGLGKHYTVYNESFFDSIGIPKSDYLIANPPYIPCEDKDRLILPYLCGGRDGNDVSKRLLSYRYKNVFLEVSSYSDPIGLIEFARGLGYKMTDFRVSQLPFGMYSRQDIVWTRINEMKKEGKAFFGADFYLIGSALFTTAPVSPDNSDKFAADLRYH